MTTPRRVLVSAYVAVSVLEVALAGASSPRVRRARRLTKPLLMPLLAASLRAAPAGERRRGTLVAQAFSWGGDVALLAPGTGPFVAGTTSFGIAHAAYTTGFVAQRDTSRRLLGVRTARVLAGGCLVTGPLMALRARERDPVLGAAVAVYSVLLTAMATTAQRVTGTPRQRRLTAAGAVLFLVSDTLLGLRRFVIADPPVALERLVMATYTTGQLLLSEGAAG